MKSQSSRPRILHVITQGHWGGAQRYISDLVTHAQGDVDVRVAVGSPDAAQDLQTVLTCPTQQLVHIRRQIHPYHDIRAFFELRRLFKHVAPDIVHLSSSKAGILGALAAATLKHKPAVVYTAHGWVFLEPGSRIKQSLYRLLERWTARYKEKIITVSHSELAAGVRIGIPKSKLVHIPLTIDAKTSSLSKSAAREALGLPRDGVVVGCIGNFYPTKGIDVLLDAIALTPAIDAVACAIIGDGQERGHIEQRIAMHHLSNVQLLGFQKNAAQFLPAFDVLVIPSRKEGLPYVLLEAQAQKIPIIASRVGGIPEYIEDKKTGLLVEPGDAASLAAALSWVLSHPNDLQPLLAPPDNSLATQTYALYNTLLRRNNA